MPRSMTGYGSAEGVVRGGRLAVEIRTVNHRYYSPQVKLPADLAALEGQVREWLRRGVERGHVTVTARWLEPPAGSGGVVVDVERARQVVAAARELKKRLRLKGDVDLAFVARQPGARLDALEAAARAIEARAPARLEAERARLQRAVADLAGGVALDEQRLAVESALLADRLDITEELVRLRAHLAACREALHADGAVGKRLGFLAQELGREVNTIGAKANDAAIAQGTIAMKGELEKLREQLENLE